MERDQLRGQFLPKEIELRLFRDIPASDVKARIDMIKSNTDKIRDTFDPEVFDVKLNNHLGYCYWEAGEYSLAISHFHKVVDILKPTDYPSLYFLVNGLLVRSNQLISKYDEAFRWVQAAFENISHANSFEKLNILKDYVDLIADANQSFEERYQSIIELVIDDLGFPEKLSTPIETINAMISLNRVWARKLSDIELKKIEDNNLRINAYENYRQACPIGWYKKYAANTITRIRDSSR